ncbi:hypothetical protein [Brevibacillus borstelensis]
MSGKRIENDEQLQKSLDWLLEKAKQLDHPLMEGEAKAKLMATYDFVSEKVQEYRREQTAKKFPYLQRMDEDLGFSSAQPVAHEEPVPESKKPVNLSDWIDG